MTYEPTGEPNTYRHPDYGLCVFRDGQTIAEFEAEMTTPREEKARVLADIALRRMKEIQKASDDALLIQAVLDKFAADHQSDLTLSGDVKAAIARRLA